MAKNLKVGDRVQVINSSLVTYGMAGTIVSKPYYKSDSFWVMLDEKTGSGAKRIFIKKRNLKKISEGEESMSKELKNYIAVAVIDQSCRDYYFAIYDDNFHYVSGMEVIVSGSAEIKTISEIITPEEASNRYSGKIISEVICPVDRAAYNRRLEERKEAENIRKEMDKIIKQMDEQNKYDMYAERNPELKELLQRYNDISC